MANTQNYNLYLPSRNDDVELDTSMAQNFQTIDDTLGGHDAQLASIALQGINVKAPFGTNLTPAKGDGVTDDTASLDAIHNYAKQNNIDVLYPSGTYKRTTGMTWDGSSYSVYGLGKVILDFTGQTTGYAISVVGQQTSSSNAYDNSTHEIAGIHLIGPNSDSTTTDCFYFNDAYNGSMLTLRKIDVYGFRDQFVYGSNTWALRFFGVSGQKSHRYIHNYTGSSNWGENYSYYGCDFYNANNSSKTASAIYSKANSNLDVNFFGCSFDYNDNEGLLNDGSFTFTGCHIEDDSVNPMFSLVASGGAIPNLAIYGGKIIPAETTAGRDSLITTKGSSSIGVIIDVGMLNSYGKYLQIIKQLDTYFPKISFRAGLFSVGGVTGKPFSYPSNMINRLNNGNFENGNLNGWNTSNIGTYTYSVETGNVHSGTYALSLSTSGASGTANISQNFNCQPGQEMIFSGWMNIPTFTSGSMYLRAIPYDKLGNQISVPTLQQVTATTSGWVGCSGKYVIPPGTFSIDFQIYLSSFQGQAYFDDLLVDFI